MIIKQELVDELEKTFHYPEKKVKQYKPCRIKFNGKFIQVGSGKTIWRDKGAARNALNNHLDHTHDVIKIAYKYVNNPRPYSHLYSRLSRDERRDLIDSLVKVGVIEFVEVDSNDFVAMR